MPSPMKNNAIDYVEFAVADIDRSKAFYGAAFGWTFTDYGPQYASFSDGQLEGGFTTEEPANPNGGPLVILYAQNLETCLDAVKQAGGNIAKEIFAFPGGRRFHFTDPDSYELAVWSEK
jgi:uncharacterized protein